MIKRGPKGARGRALAFGSRIPQDAFMSARRKWARRQFACRRSTAACPLTRRGSDPSSVDPAKPRGACSVAVGFCGSDLCVPENSRDKKVRRDQCRLKSNPAIRGPRDSSFEARPGIGRLRLRHGRASLTAGNPQLVRRDHLGRSFFLGFSRYRSSPNEEWGFASCKVS